MNNNIAIIRHTRGMTQRELADKAGMSQSRLADYERGELNAENMSLRKAIDLAKALKCPVGDLIGKTKKKYLEADMIMNAIDKQVADIEKAVAENDLDALVNNPLAR